MRGEGKVENRKSVQEKFTAVDFGIAPDIDLDSASIELPLWVRQFACGDGAVVYEIVIGTGFLHYLAGEGKWRRRSEDYAVAVKAQAGGSDDVIELARLGEQVVCSAAGSDVVIVGPTIERKVALRLGFSGVGVVRGLVGAKDIRAIVNLDGLMQFVNRSVFFLGY